MKRTIPVIAILFVLVLLSIVSQQSSAAFLLGTPAIEYLGEGGNYSVAAGRHFIVKHKSPFTFVVEPGPSYDAAPEERVWAASVGAPAPHVRTWVEYGRVWRGCKISYTAIDDDPDNRINRFYIGDDVVHEMPQGFVTGGSFEAPKDGNLRLDAIDSIGVWLSKCADEEPPTPTGTAPPQATATTTPMVTSTAGPSLTPSATPEVTSTVQAPTPVATATATKKPRLPACLRINFEGGGDLARAGRYEVREVGGRLLYTWYAQEGWYDSGWIHGIDISFESVFIEVFYLPDEGEPIQMVIVNPAPGTPYGWLARGMCHALEVKWPDENVTPTPTPDAFDGFNDLFDAELLDLQRYIWPGIRPSPTSTPASSLRG